MARSRRRVVSQGSAEPPIPDDTPSAPEAAAAPEPSPEPEPEPAPKPKRPARRAPGRRFRTIAWVRFTDREVPPGTELDLDEAQAERLLKIGGVEPMEN
jgi:hypothetical protein